MKYKIEIGKVLRAKQDGLLVEAPQQTIIITEEQAEVIKEFAHTRKDKDLNTIYILNECEFRMVPHFDFDTIKENPADKLKLKKK